MRQLTVFLGAVIIIFTGTNAVAAAKTDRVTKLRSPIDVTPPLGKNTNDIRFLRSHKDDYDNQERANDFFKLPRGVNLTAAKKIEREWHAMPTGIKPW
ncbi:secreted RxLR effector peptide protein, putative [Phytophthora infestans T30-4]|uniref:RxLR effector protein n=1 Tax=Phytophthora infestans (strain T30-4) TaxID=403677 RepID=D0NJU6_PHYIT|nr:secreted RxLR effector peptide protein, putative [Phytophthora infestans T30-4]EEY59783.1 secreted RxLR effector peptide protein, putative [Phytophthora infestans T30-4]|eukprot:XP_002900468.1 secreted RxLR effector peptide protein, putative [Phytophthora infestans T30-4]